MNKAGLLSTLVDRAAKLDGSIYRHYRKIEGTWSEKRWSLVIQKAQSDPKASPSRVALKVPHVFAGFSPSILDSAARRIALADFMLRKLHALCPKISRHSGPGKSGIFYCDHPGPQILERSSVHFSPRFVEIRFRYGLPARGARIDAAAFQNALRFAFPRVAAEILNADAYPPETLDKHLECYEDQEHLRAVLWERDLVCFIPDGAVLPRESSRSTLPLSNAVPFRSPESLRLSFDLPHRGRLSGMGIPRGITLIAGGGFHGKTTLLNAIRLGIYNHVPGDGREFAVSLPDTFKVNAEDGRSAEGLDLSPYIRNLPLEKSSNRFSSAQCSGSTSQAASTLEAIRMGSRCLLFDEDRSATNFLLCDPAMKRLIGEKDRTVQPFLETARSLFDTRGVSSILVTGSFSPGFQAAHRVLKLSSYRVSDVTREARSLLDDAPRPVLEEKTFRLDALDAPRILDSASFRIHKRKTPLKTRVLSSRQIRVGPQVLDFFDNEHLVDIGQAKTLLSLLLRFEKLVFKKRLNLESAVRLLWKETLAGGLPGLDENDGGMVQVRPLDFAHVLNRFRFLKIRVPAKRPDEPGSPEPDPDPPTP